MQQWRVHPLSAITAFCRSNSRLFQSCCCVSMENPAILSYFNPVRCNHGVVFNLVRLLSQKSGVIPSYFSLVTMFLWRVQSFSTISASCGATTESFSASSGYYHRRVESFSAISVLLSCFYGESSYSQLFQPCYRAVTESFSAISVSR